jgi:hypothetical protein
MPFSMSSKLPRLAAALCGILGAVTLVSSFAINPAPPANFTLTQLRDFALQHHRGIVLGAWLQLVLFAIALVHFAGATHRFAGWVTLLSGATILMVSLVEVTFYLAAVQAAESSDSTSGMVSNALIRAVQHVFLIAPALLLPVGAVLLGSRVLPRSFAYLALAMGSTLQILGLVGLFSQLQPIIDVLLIVQALWFVAAGIALFIHYQDL